MTDMLPDGKSVALDAPIERDKMNLVHMRLFDNQGRSPVTLAERHKTVEISAVTPEPVVVADHRPEGATRVDVQCLSDIYLRYDGDTVKVMENKGSCCPENTSRSFRTKRSTISSLARRRRPNFP